MTYGATAAEDARAILTEQIAAMEKKLAELQVQRDEPELAPYLRAAEAGPTVQDLRRAHLRRVAPPPRSPLHCSAGAVEELDQADADRDERRLDVEAPRGVRPDRRSRAELASALPGADGCPPGLAGG